MKKSIIIVVIIGIAILGILIWFNKAKPLDQAINNLQTAKNENLEKMKDAVMKSATLQLVIMADDYYQKNQTVFFEKDPGSISKVEQYFAGIKSQRGIDVEYKMFSSKTAFVAKTKTNDANNFYCLDTVSESVQPSIIQVLGDNFSTATDCNGVVLK